MRLQLNGSETDTGATTVLDLLVERGVDPQRRGIAVARNGDLVLRSEWETVELADGDAVEVITAMQGG